MRHAMLHNSKAPALDAGDWSFDILEHASGEVMLKMSLALASLKLPGVPSQTPVVRPLEMFKNSTLRRNLSQNANLASDGVEVTRMAFPRITVRGSVEAR